MYKPNEPQINPQSVLSFVLGMLTMFFFCLGVIPVPLTGILCLPGSFISAILALIYGVISLRKIRNGNKPSILMSWTGIVMGAFALLCLVCVIAALIAVFNFAPDYLKYLPEMLPDWPQFWQPFNDNYQL